MVLLGRRSTRVTTLVISPGETSPSDATYSRGLMQKLISMLNRFSNRYYYAQ